MDEWMAYGQCPCGSPYVARRVEVRFNIGGQAVTLTDVPQGRCDSCGSRVYKARIIEELEAVMRGRTHVTPRPAPPP